MVEFEDATTMSMLRLDTKRVVQHTLVVEHVTPAPRLLEKRRQMFDVQESLEHQKVEFNR